MNTHKSDPKYSKRLIPIRQSLEPELQDGASTSTGSTELHVSNDGASTGMISFIVLTVVSHTFLSLMLIG